ncbi:thioesterase [Anabaena cylindrica FACHB-243]|uniref:thioesterase II family protein n=1 Tax=Anabaena TaxID=1163 RepID=UPI0002DAE06E|nr:MULTISPECIES: thioesterase domain-containing protein [Anabaena]MBD2418959.1 thioesterase [Anabaena cylindrica FACHB-243]MBY5285101.1 thioesterase [Anabaena sp. CCAP 1446/1C]MBY5308833.1 thioesterase [Anabaena sp. CCAP 1446/1C]MCM2409508.1 thioesterase domain-containing protein [Anabaena sp. CCAP 1446/1C]BAY06230.1 thioesterase [Anabaena cylindrica PCC 7122]
MVNISNEIIRYQSYSIFCFPYAGGSTSTYRQWSEILPSDIEVCPVQLPGRENKSMKFPFTHVTQLVENLLPVLIPYLDLCYAFFGHSMAALISFELARQIQKRHYLEPQHLFVSGRRSPLIPSSDPPIDQLLDTIFL